jgi:hypothetical protein
MPGILTPCASLSTAGPGSFSPGKPGLVSTWVGMSARWTCARARGWPVVYKLAASPRLLVRKAGGTVCDGLPLPARVQGIGCTIYSGPASGRASRRLA